MWRFLRRGIGFVLTLILFVTNLALPVYADNCTQIRAKYDSAEVVINSTKVAEEYSATILTYGDVRQEYLRSQSKKATTELTRERLRASLSGVQQDIDLLSTELNEVERKLMSAVDLEASLDTIYTIEQDYLVTKQKLTDCLVTESYLVEFMLQVGGMEEAILEVTAEELYESYKIAQLMRREYDIAKQYDNIGIVDGVGVPTSNGRYIVNSAFGTRPNPFGGGSYQFHNGLDLKATLGENNLALFKGVVVVSEWSNSYGNYVIIDHGYGVKTLYAHATQNLVTVGMEVEQYQKIQNVGSTGYSTGPHLHLGVMIDGTLVDPAILFR